MRSEVQAFLAHEASLIDAAELEEWLGLFTDGARYWIPARADALDPLDEVSLVYDDRSHLGERVARIGSSFVQQVPSRTVHVVGAISSIEVLGDRIRTKAPQIVVELRRGVQTTYAAVCEHVLVDPGGPAPTRSGAAFEIELKVVRLLNAAEPLVDLSFIL